LLLDRLKPVSRDSVSDRIVDQLVALISQGDLTPGQRIPSEKELCQRFGVGRTSVREALRSLSAMGILESHAGEGTFVSEDKSRYLENALRWGLLLDRRVVEDLVEARLLLESQTAYLAARKATGDQLGKMEAAVAGMEASLQDPDRYLAHDLEFHLMIARATRNSILYHFLSLTRGPLQSWIRNALGKSERRARLSIAEHRKILAALRKRNAEQARRAMAAHILSSSADLSRQLGRKHPSRPVRTAAAALAAADL
jgi:GntR family transcriptional repressor for pyruvate dehydrogenase complex